MYIKPFGPCPTQNDWLQPLYVVRKSSESEKTELVSTPWFKPFFFLYGKMSHDCSFLFLLSQNCKSQLIPWEGQQFWKCCLGQSSKNVRAGKLCEVCALQISEPQRILQAVWVHSDRMTTLHWVDWMGHLLQNCQKTPTFSLKHGDLLFPKQGCLMLN